MKYVLPAASALLVALVVTLYVQHTKLQNRNADIAELAADTTRYGQRYRMLFATQRADRAALDEVNAWVLQAQAKRMADSLYQLDLRRAAASWRDQALSIQPETLYVPQPLPEGETECPALAIPDFRAWLADLDQWLPLYEP